MHNFDELEHLLDSLTSKLSIGETYRFNRALAVVLRRSQSDRIRRQENPDGSKFQRRSLNKVTQKRRDRRNLPMFRKLRSARFLRFRVTPDEIQIGFFGGRGAGYIALQHQEGLTGKIGNHKFILPERSLLGITDADEKAIYDALITYFDDVL
ncbi:hypothetical protein AAEX37_01019 [Oligella sp. MSHR50489EDL]|uniref:phage virion morphogenesis protein n=1 Tax=Oligella sp. MSHR50489EDL TaxID=3139409 RepID=UPI003D814DE9